MWPSRKGSEKRVAPMAERDDLGEGSYRDVTLPFLGKRVRVRYLDTPEVARLQHLPDLLQYSEKALKIMQGRDEEVDAADLAAEQLTYYAYIAHLAVVDHTAPAPEGELPEPVVCAVCSSGSVEVAHPPSLWAPSHTKRMQPTDLNTIMLVALSAQGRFADVSPFSRDQQRRASRSRAASGE